MRGLLARGMDRRARFLVKGNQLYLGVTVQDSSVGGSENFNRFDGLLMAIKDHTILGSNKPPAEYFYSWWYPDSLTPDPAMQYAELVKAATSETGFQSRLRAIQLAWKYRRGRLPRS